jgi:hypothetical protein
VPEQTPGRRRGLAPFGMSLVFVVDDEGDHAHVRELGDVASMVLDSPPWDRAVAPLQVTSCPEASSARMPDHWHRNHF